MKRLSAFLIAARAKMAQFFFLRPPIVLKNRKTDYGYESITFSESVFLKKCVACGEKTSERIITYEIDGRTGGFDGPPDCRLIEPMHLTCFFEKSEQV